MDAGWNPHRPKHTMDAGPTCILRNTCPCSLVGQGYRPLVSLFHERWRRLQKRSSEKGSGTAGDPGSKHHLSGSLRERRMTHTVYASVESFKNWRTRKVQWWGIPGRGIHNERRRHVESLRSGNSWKDPKDDENAQIYLNTPNNTITF